MQHIPQTLEKSEKILKEQGVSDAQKILKRVLKKLGVQETSEEPKAVALEDGLNARKISKKVPVMLDTQKILETLEILKRASGNVYKEWEENKFDINYWFEVDCLHERYSYTLLYLAIDFKLDSLIDALLEVKEIDINARGPFSQWGALHWATETSNIRVVLELIKRGADVNQVDSYQQTSLHQPAANGDVEITKILIKNNADVNSEDLGRLTALYKAASHSHTEAVKILMDSGKS